MRSKAQVGSMARRWAAAVASVVGMASVAGCESAPAASNAPQHDASDATGGDAKTAAGGNCHLGQICTEICNGVDDDCDGLTDETATGTLGLCDDDNPCTADSCGGTQGCVNLPANGSACSDGDACTGPDLCQGGTCTSPPLNCDDQDPCTVDACAAGSGCTHPGGVGAVCGGTGLCGASGCVCPSGEVVAADGTCGTCTCSVAGSAVTLPQPVTALHSPSLGGDQNFGHQVFFRGSQLFVSSPGAMGLPETSATTNPNAGRGAVFVYQRTAVGWLPQARIDLANPGNYRGFGRELAVNPQGDRLAATSGDLGNAIPESPVWVYERAANGSWNQVAGPFLSPTPILPLAQNFNWGSGLALDGDWLAIGDATRPQASTDQSRGRVIMVQRAANGTWTMGQTLWGADPIAQFGSGVALQGTTMAIGAPSVTANVAGIAGTVTIATLQNGTWTPVQTLTAPATRAPLPSDALGFALELHGDDLYVSREAGGCSPQGASGSIVHYKRSNGTFALVGNVAAPTANCDDEVAYGRTFAVDGANVVVASFAVPYSPLLRGLVPTLSGGWHPAWRELAPLPPSAQGPLVWAPPVAPVSMYAFLSRQQLAADHGRLAFVVFPAAKSVVEVFEPSAGLCGPAGACACLPGYSGADCSLAVCQNAGDCNDQNPCTTDGCVTQNGSNACVHTANSGPCDDGSACTTGETCSGGSCQPGTAVGCDDQNACTVDSCSPSDGCQHVLAVGPCDDGKACTENDSCQPKVGCQGTPFNCDDQNPCTVDACKEPSGGATTPSCIHTNIPGSTVPCDDGDACSADTVCKAGACVGGTDTVCDDGDPCTFDTCDPQSGCSSQFNLGAACGAGGTCTLAGCVCPAPQVLQPSGTCADCTCAVAGSLAGQFSAVDITGIGVPDASTPVSGAPHAHNHTQLQTVAMAGDYLVTGWLMNDLPGAPVKGLVRVLKKQGGQWQLVQDLGHPSGTAGPAGPATSAQLSLARFGMNVALNEDATRLAVSTFALDSIAIFSRSGNTFAYETTLWPPAGAEGNRTQVLSLHGDILAVGHEHYSGLNAYSAAPALRIYQRQASGSWQLQADGAPSSPL
ncbi:MAG: hypothetical protein HY902_03325, partial [Deltaproteobacteria bacterium]|nr:hypothetical protein [Deltaproteobacteria bacterium]